MLVPDSLTSHADRRSATTGKTAGWHPLSPNHSFPASCAVAQHERGGVGKRRRSWAGAREGGSQAGCQAAGWRLGACCSPEVAELSGRTAGRSVGRSTPQPDRGYATAPSERFLGSSVLHPLAACPLCITCPAKLSALRGAWRIVCTWRMDALRISSAPVGLSQFSLTRAVQAGSVRGLLMAQGAASRATRSRVRATEDRGQRKEHARTHTQRLLLSARTTAQYPTC